MAEEVLLFADGINPLIGYLQVRGRAALDVLHLRDFETHETLRLDAGSVDSVWEIRRQREWDPIQERKVMD